MATRIRTLNFLPEIFKTTTNSQFLQATLDQLVAQPNTKRIEGYIGSKFGYGINANDKYVVEPTKVRTDYQLEPGVVFTKANDTTAQDFISYPGILDALKLEGALTNNNNRLFNSQFYSWDSFTDLDKIINFNQYYWLPEGPERVTISTEIVFNTSNYVVNDIVNGYLITSETQPIGTINPTLTLLRGGTYTFSVNQASQFWIQGAPGITGYDPTQPNVQTRDVLGVTNNGATNGVVTFTVPPKNAQNEFNFPGNNTVDVISTLPFDQVNGARVNDIGGIDGITSLEGLTVMFYDTGVPFEQGYVSKFYDQTTYDQDGGLPYDEETDYPGSVLNYNNFEGGFYTDVSGTFYTITYVGDVSNPTIQLIPAGTIPTNEKITALYGTEWVGRHFYRNISGAIALIPYNSAILDTLYYQDGTTANKVGIIKIVDSNVTNRLDIITEILGRKQYTSSAGVVFTNGLKVVFQGDVYPESYRNVEYYVEGVGTAIELIPVQSLVSPGLFTEGSYIPYDTTPYDIGNYDSSLYVPVTPDYITIARNAINKNAWSRSNRWFHIDVIKASAQYNNNPALVTQYATLENKAKRPIIEFYANLRLFDSGVIGKDPVDFIDFRTSDAFSQVAGQTNYYPDVAGWTTNNATIYPVTGANTSVTATETLALVNQVVLSSTTGLYVNDTITFTSTPFDANIVEDQEYFITAIDYDSDRITISTERQGPAVVLEGGTGSMTTSIWSYTTIIEIPTTDVYGLFQLGLYVTDSADVLPTNSTISKVEVVGSNTLVYVSWYSQSVVPATSDVNLVTTDTTADNYALFDGSRVIFAADTNPEVRNKIYTAHFNSITGTSTPVITLTEAEDGNVLADEQTAVYRGYNYQGKDFYFDGLAWFQGQQKETVNQAPRFDVFDSNGISFGDSDVYVGTSFTGSTLFTYGLGSGLNDPVLGFPIRYSSVDNVGDITFDVSLNSQTFNYVQGTTPITQPVNSGYVYNYTDRTSFVRQLGWQTAVSPSVQYQIFDINYVASNPTLKFTCDIAPVDTSTTNWPVIQVYINNVIQTVVPEDQIATASSYDCYYTTTADSTTVTFASTVSETDTVVQILILSDQVSDTAYYQVPINLNNNPLNADVTTVNVGDIRGQYQSAFYNNPNTTGNVFGANNYRDLGNMVPWANRIIQNSASLVLPGTFLRKQNHNLFDALLYNSRQYITFKSLLVDTVNNSNYTTYLTPSQMLDDALDQMTANKNDSEPFFWTDMVPNKAAYITNTYSFANSLDVSIYPLSRVYDFSTANYYGVLVYLTRSGKITQLIRGVDYTVSTDSPSLTITLDLLPNDQITIKEYNQTYGSYAPSTPTKLGLYPATIPSVVLDTAYTQPTYFIVGHDGSYNKLYGDYNPQTQTLVDFRDQVLLEYEKRVYNNLKVSNVIPVQEYEVLPGFFRDTDYTYDEFLEIYSESFLNWVGQNRINYKNQIYSKSNQFTYNYRDSGNKINKAPIEIGYWRGIYQYFYDTSNPDTSPWEMLGYKNQPSWWVDRYGPAPYTSQNTVLWSDLAAGYDYNNGAPFIAEQYVRPQLLTVLPVDSYGNLVSPLVSVVGSYNQNIFGREWQVGDVGPAEFSYRRSSSWPFDLMRILALTKPAKFFNLAVDVDHYKYNVEFNQYLFDNRTHIKMSDIDVYGSGTPVTSYINWIVDYEKQVGVDATQNITNLLSQLDVRLVYRLAGFSDKNMLKFYVEKSTANSQNSSLLIPDESYAVLLYDNQPFDRIVYSGVVVQITSTGYQVFGNSQTNAYFTIQNPRNSGNFDTVEVENLKVKITKDYYDTTSTIPYGAEFHSVQEVATFLAGYGEHLTRQGLQQQEVENGIPVNWSQMVAEFLYWAQTGWEVGSITTLNPSATNLLIDKDSYIVQPLTLRQQNFVLNQNLYPIQTVDMSIVREGTAFNVKPLNQGDTLAYGQFNISNFEHGIVFDNTTLFGDIIYNLTTGLRQNRITVRGTKTADWNGTIDAQGFILNQDNILEWSREVKYTKGSIVKYKNKYWTAIKIVQAKEIFDEKEWKETDYNEIQKGLLPNGQTRSYESTIYYDVNKPNLENDADLLSFSLIGYRPRDYLALADLTDITQINVYKNMIKDKGTLNAASAFKGATLAQGGINYDIYENWAIKSGEFGGVLNSNFAEFKLNETLLTGNPSIVGLTNSDNTEGVQQEVQLYNLFNYGRPITDANILATIPSGTPDTLFPSAGYVNFGDVKLASYYYSGLGLGRNQYGTLVPLENVYVGDYIWLANYLEKWQVYSPVSIGTVVQAVNNLNNTVTITFAKPHNLSKYEIFAIVNFNTVINGYQLVAAVVDPYRVVINAALSPDITNITGQGVALRMHSHRIADSAEINTIPLLDNEFTKSKVWVDVAEDGNWAVYRKSLNYAYDIELNGEVGEAESFGSAVAYTNSLGYLIGDAEAGKVYRYKYNPLNDSYTIAQTLTGTTSFGSSIVYSDDTILISNPDDGEVYVYTLVTTSTANNLVETQVLSGSAGFGTGVAISGDKNWIYVSTPATPDVQVFRKSSVTDEYELVETLTVAGVGSTDNFGQSLATDYYGDTVVIGTPDQNNGSYDNYGYTYVFSRTVQNLEASYTSIPYLPQDFTLAWTPNTTTVTVTATAASTNRLTCASSSVLDIGSPIVFSGTIIDGSGISANQVYYVLAKPTSTTFTVSLTRGGSAVALSTASGSMTGTQQDEPLFVSVNGTVVDDSTYSVKGNTLSMYSSATPALTAGDIVTVSGTNFVLTQTLDNGISPRTGVQFGQSVATNNYANELLVGAPFELNSENVEGAVHRFTNGGEKYGMIIGTADCNITTPRVILLNGYSVTLPVGDASNAANAINAANITNVTATSIDGKLVISLIDVDLAIPSEKLSLTVLNTATPGEMGISVFTETQVIRCPHTAGPTQFGSVIKLNSNGSFVASAPTGTRWSATTFDFTDDENLDNDTIFDNNATQWIDQDVNAGAVYMFDYIPVYNETISNPGKYVYAQSVNGRDSEYGAQPLYGSALDFNDNTVVIGTPNFIPGTVSGQVVIYKNASGVTDWSVYRVSSPVVDIEGIQNSQLFSAETNNTLINLDYLDPLQGKLLGAVRQNIDVVSNVDPAGYNSIDNTQSGLVWGADKIGQIWFNTSNVRFLNYHQDDVVYNSKNWGKVFPGSDVAVYTWVASNVPPVLYTGPGIPFNADLYTVQSTINAENTLSPIYYFWVRNTNVVYERAGKTLSDTIIQTYIANPQASGISYFAPLLPNVFGIYNSQEYINANDTVFHIGYKTGKNDDVSHNLYTLIRTNYADDFLPGLPSTTGLDTPESLYDRLLDSMCGVDETGEVVPNPWLPKAVQYGILARPRQSFFINRFKALQNYLQYANEILAQFPISEIRNPSFLNTEGSINPSNGQPFYVTQDYWSYKNWWAAGYDDNTKSALQVPLYSDLATLQVSAGTIVTVASNGVGKAEVYRYNADGSWTRIGLNNGTIEFSSALWDYKTNRLGFGDNFFDTAPYDEYPSEETRYIIRSLNEEIYTDELQIYRNKSLVLLFEYIQSETIENQNYLPWLNKTSFIDVAHTIRELLPLEVFKSDNQNFLEGYLNEVKPYHVVIKEFLFKYTGTDVYEGDITDFDLPATYNTELQQYITPQLVYANPSGDNQYLPSDPIWQTAPYQQWFNNQGISFAGENNFNIATLESYISLNSSIMYVNNASGFPVTGIVKIGTEQIGYSGVDLASSSLTGLTRGVNGTEISIHLPGEKIYIDLPGVIVLDGGRAYAEPPKVTAYIDTTIYPEPRVPAQLEAVMGLDSVLSINVINPGEGYVITPTIVIDPSIVVNVSSSQVSTINNTIQLDVPLLQTGDLVTFTVSTGSTPIGGLVPGQRYYVGVLETSPSTVVALYNNYFNAVNDNDRVILSSAGVGTQIFSLGAVASSIMDAGPVRENHITLRFDRTSYTSQVRDWSAGSYYGSFYAGTYFNSDTVASSSITLQTTRPPINSLLASAQGVAFEILDVENDQVMTWSSRTRNVVQTYNDNTIRITPSEGGSPVTTGKMGATEGFYVGMPVKFVGAGFGGITVDTTYYVKSLVDVAGEATGFTISATIDENGVPGTVVDLTAATASPAGLLLYVANVTNTAVLTINYPGIRDVTATASGTNALTSPLIVTGQNGTSGFYPGLPLVFTGAVFGGVLENETYYVTTVIDSETFTMSTNSNPTVISVTGTSSVNNSITCSSTLDLTVGEKVMFSNMTINGESVTEFGGLENGVVYYVNSILAGNTSFTVVEAIGDAVKTLTTQASGSGTGCFVTSQDDVIELTTSTGSMTMNVALPVSPGQINGQQFTMYQSSTDDYTNVSGPVTNLLTRAVSASVETDASEYRLYFDQYSAGTTNMYFGLPFTLSANIGGLVAGTTYTVEDTGVAEFTVTFASTTGNRLTTTDTSILFVGMPVVFSNESLGGVSVNTTYYVRSIPNSTQFTISASPLGSTITILSNQGGTMNAVGAQYITIADAVTTEVKDVTLTQYMTPANYPSFNVGYALGGYIISSVTDAGTGLVVDNTIVIDGADLGGISGTNDLTITVTAVDTATDGGFVSGIRSGTPAGTTTQYYFKVISEDKVAVYSNSNMTIPVSGLNFPYVGVTSTTVTTATASNDRFTVGTSSTFEINDSVVFTGTVFGGVVLGQTYYIKSKPTSTTVTISETLGGSTFNIATNSSGSMTMAKTGDFALLPEPFYFNSSVVKYNNRVYQCIISNNDPEFIFGKWELLDSGDARLNALDRITGYYQPTVNMPGLDLSQLVSGITYPNSTYLGNAFAPDQEFELDTLLQDQPFYPTQVDINSITWDGVTYLAGSNTPDYSAVLLSTDGETWGIDKLSNQTIGITNILYAGGKYLITTSNDATPLVVSEDGVTWTTDYTLNTTTSTNSFNGSVYYNGLYLVAGNNIMSSSDLVTWNEVYNFGSSLQNYFYGITYASTAGFTGFVAVGHGQLAESIVVINNVPVIRTSTDGVNWNTINFTATSYGFNAVTANNQNVVAVGDNGIIYTSFNTLVWFAQSSGTTEILNDVKWLNGQFIAVGENGTILTAPIDGVTWTSRTSNTTENLTSVVWNEDLGHYVVVGDNNTILQSTNGITWTSTSLFITDPTVYNVQGDAFTAGYGPEEMVPGVVTDAVTMTVVTRPGTNWDATEYQHVGYNVVSVELAPTSANQVEYSFAGLAETPAQVAAFVINNSTGLSTSIYESLDYSVNWISKTITLNNPLNFISIGNSDSLRIDVYEVGNGDQLVKANTETDPIVNNSTTGFDEIYLNCNYSSTIYNGSGVIRPSTVPLEAIAISSDEVTDTITVDDVSGFVLNGPVTFSGAVFGGIVEDQTYYVKTISYVSNRISLSETYTVETGTAGPTFPLTSYSGPDTMTAIIRVGTGSVWTDPIVYHNGTKLVLGTTGTITRTKSSTNTITCNTTGALAVNDPIVFSDTMIGGVVPQQVYYVKSIYDGNEFTISETVGGAEVSLTNAIGGAIYITNDYAFGIATNGISAKMMFSNQYNASSDYIVYSIFGETFPIQYGYTIPETQVFEGDGSSVAFSLVNYVSGSNPENAIVEVDGLRLTASQYNINTISSQLVLYTTPPASGSAIAVTSYNLTDRQYFNTTFGTSGTGVASITVTSTTHQSGLYDENSPSIETFDQNTPTVVAYDEQLDWLTTSDTSVLSVDDTIIFSNVIGGLVAGVTYYVVEILNSTDFVVSTELGGTPTVVTSATGSMTGVLNGQTVADIVNIDNNITPPLAIAAVTSTSSTGNLITCSSTSGFVVGQTAIFKSAVGVPGFGGIDTDGTVYYVRSISSNTEFTIEDEFGNLITLSTASGNMYVYVGGTPAVRVTTGINHNLSENAIVRLDGIIGSTELNNNVYYAKVINLTQVDLYQEAYDPAYGAVNSPITAVSSYVTDGYIWLAGLFTLETTRATASHTGDNTITVISTDSLVENTPVIFTNGYENLGTDILGGIIAGQTYYVKDIVDSTTFTISETHSGPEFALSDATETVTVTQWEQVNVDRLWVTVNGYRVPSSKLRINSDNDISILTTVQSGDVVVITSMMPTATPNEETYLLNVSTTNQAAVYRANPMTRTWLTQPLSYTDETIYVNDVSRLVSVYNKTFTTPSYTPGVSTFTEGIAVDKNSITQITVYNNTTGTTVPASAYSLELQDTAPVLVFSGSVAVGDEVTITVVLGRTIYVAGEAIMFRIADLENNTLSGLQRGVDGTGEREFIPEYSEVYGLLSTNRMTDVQYGVTWNSDVYDTLDGDPLQISTTAAARFLRVDGN